MCAYIYTYIKIYMYIYIYNTFTIYNIFDNILLEINLQTEFCPVNILNIKYSLYVYINATHTHTLAYRVSIGWQLSWPFFLLDNICDDLGVISWHIMWHLNVFSLVFEMSGHSNLTLGSILFLISTTKDIIMQVVKNKYVQICVFNVVY